MLLAVHKFSNYVRETQEQEKIIINFDNVALEKMMEDRQINMD